MMDLSPTDKELLRAAIAKHLSGQLAAAEKAAKAALDEQMRKGDALAIRSPIDGTKIGRVSKSDPGAKATVANREDLVRWIETHHPEKLVDDEVIVGSEREILAVLREHAPHLVADGKRVPDWEINDLVVKSAAAGEPVGFNNEKGDDAPPGITVTVPDGVLSVVLDKINGPAALQALWEQRLFAMDGTVRELPAGDQAA